MLIGNVGQDPTVKYLEGGVCVASVRLATTERGYTLQNGTQVPERTQWHNVIFWRKLGETVEKYVHKGDKLYVEGKIQSRDYTDKLGKEHKTYDIVADNMEMLTPKNYDLPNRCPNVPATRSQRRPTRPQRRPPLLKVSIHPATCLHAPLAEKEYSRQQPQALGQHSP